LRARGRFAPGDIRSHVPPPLSAPFATATPVEHERILQLATGPAADPPDGVAFLDGTQRWIVERWIGIQPVVRAHVAAAVLRRVGGALSEADSDFEEFRVVPRHRVPADWLAELGKQEMAVLDAGGDDRAHPLLDLRQAALRVEGRRAALERKLAARYLAARGGEWLVVDGSIDDLTATTSAGAALLGLVKSHDTQYLDGADLEAALTLPEGHRTSVFARESGERGRVFTWYLRLWPWDDHDLLHGLVRVERPPEDDAVATASEVSRWLLAERAPLAAPDERWDRLLYPIRRVETYLGAQAGGWW